MYTCTWNFSLNPAYNIVICVYSDVPIVHMGNITKRKIGGKTLPFSWRTFHNFPSQTCSTLFPILMKTMTAFVFLGEVHGSC